MTGAAAGSQPGCCRKVRLCVLQALRFPLLSLWCPVWPSLQWLGQPAHGTKATEVSLPGRTSLSLVLSIEYLLSIYFLGDTILDQGKAFWTATLHPGLKSGSRGAHVLGGFLHPHTLEDSTLLSPARCDMCKRRDVSVPTLPWRVSVARRDSVSACSGLFHMLLERFSEDPSLTQHSPKAQPTPAWIVTWALLQTLACNPTLYTNILNSSQPRKDESPPARRPRGCFWNILPKKALPGWGVVMGPCDETRCIVPRVLGV